MGKFRYLASASLMLAIPAIVANSPAWAQTADGAGGSIGLEDIVVTAQKRAENLQETPIAISALDTEALQKLGVASISDLSTATPSLYTSPYPNSPTTVMMFIRGMGTTNPYQITKDGAVGLYLDGFYLSRPQSATIDMADIERVEILRGPQGTLYGRNTTGGAVNIVTRKPTGEAGVRGSLQVGTLDTLRALTNIDLPAVGDFAAKMTFLASNRDGWTRNSGGKDFGGMEQVGGELALRWTPGDVATVDYAYDLGRVNSTALYYNNDVLEGFLPGYASSRKRAYRPIDLPETATRYHGHRLSIEVEASDSLTLRSLSAYRYLNAESVQDYQEIWSTPSINQVTNVRPSDKIKSRQYSQEFQLVGSLGATVEYVLGLYYFQEKASHFSNVLTVTGQKGASPLSISRDRTTRVNSRSAAAFSQVQWTPDILESRLSFIAGARYTWDKRRAQRDEQQIISLANGAVAGETAELGLENRQKFRKFNPSGTISFAFNETVNGYAKVSTGYRAGGSDEGALIFDATFRPETLVNYEMGLKSDLFDRRLRLNLAAFWMDYDDIQIEMQPKIGATSISQTVNAGKGRMAGLEAELTAALSENVRISGSWTWLKPKLKSVLAEPGGVLDPASNPESPYRLGENLADYFVFTYAPEHSFSASLDATLARFGEDSVDLFLSWSWKDRAFVTGGAGPAVPGRDHAAIPSHGVVDARLTWSIARDAGDPWTVSLWARNLLDNKYWANIVPVGNALTGYTGEGYTYGQPRMIGLQLNYNF